MAMSGCEASIDLSKDVPERPHPTTKKGAAAGFSGEAAGSSLRSVFVINVQTFPTRYA
jgi:hypothetical protein